jgi:hypothetical protein
VSEYYPETRFAVLTANPELKPLAVYEIEHGVFSTPADAMPAVKALLKKGHDVQIEKRRWVEFKTDYTWFNAAHWSD